MAANMSDYLEASLLNSLFRSAAAFKPAFIYMGVWTATLTDASTGATAGEPAGGAYARVAVTQADGTWNAPGVGGLIDNVAAISFVAATGHWGTITDVGITDTSTIAGGNMIMYGALTVAKSVTTGDTLRFNAGDFDITFS